MLLLYNKYYVNLKCSTKCSTLLCSRFVGMDLDELQLIAGRHNIATY